MDEVVTINGVRWSTRNVGEEPGTFVSSYEGLGGHYIHTEAKKVCPLRFRPPFEHEIKTLLDETKVSNELVSYNGVNGRKFTDIESGNYIFLPAAGMDLFRDGEHGYYLSSDDEDTYQGNIIFNSNETDFVYSGHRIGYSIRPVLV